MLAEKKKPPGQRWRELRHQAEGLGDAANSIVVEVIEAKEQSRKRLSLHESHFLSQTIFDSAHDSGKFAENQRMARGDFGRDRRCGNDDNVPLLP